MRTRIFSSVADRVHVREKRLNDLIKIPNSQLMFIMYGSRVTACITIDNAPPFFETLCSCLEVLVQKDYSQKILVAIIYC